MYYVVNNYYKSNNTPMITRKSLQVAASTRHVPRQHVEAIVALQYSHAVLLCVEFLE
jgi:hypothetical protein